MKRSGLLKWLQPGKGASAKDHFNIPPGANTERLIHQAKVALSQAEPDQALQYLSDLNTPALDVEIDLQSGRLADYRRNRRHGVQAPDEENRIFNRITRDLFDLITTLERELAAGTEYYETIRDYLKKRYNSRLEQKLANRQPVNLRRIVNTEVMPGHMGAAFVPHGSADLGGALQQTFRDARGRLLLVGAPGAGKTTLMLQLVLELLESERDELPVLLNLATWSKEYVTLEGWLKVILAAEIGVSERYAAEIIQQNHLIPLLDGFDEIREEDRLSCLEAINRYGEDAHRQYVISSRKQEFDDVNKGVMVHLPIEVCPLTLEQLKTELLRLWENPDHPERGAKLLLDAIDKDALLREVVKTPFYFNTLQILFNGGMTLGDMQFTADSVEGRQAEIRDRFVEYELKVHVHQDYPAEKAKHWLAFLASRMTSRNMVVFELRDLQYDWWKWAWGQLVMARVVWGLVAGIVAAIVIGVTYGLFFAMFFGIPAIVYGGVFAGMAIGVAIFLEYSYVAGFWAGLIAGIVSMFRKKRLLIETKDSIHWSWSFLLQRYKEILPPWIAGGMVLGMMSGIALIEPKEIRRGLVEYVLKENLMIGVIYGLFVGLILGIGVGLVSLFKHSKNIIQITTPYQRFRASMKSLYFSILQHKFLCYQLRGQGLLPPNLVTFLNEMCARHLMETDGATWRFRHRILQEWFAGEWEEGIKR